MKRKAILRKFFFGSCIGLSVGSSAADYIVAYRSAEAFKLNKSAPLGNKIFTRGELNALNMLIVSSDDKGAIENLKSNPAIEFVEEDRVFPLPDFPKLSFNKSASPARFNERTPWGILNVNAPQAWALSGDKGSNARVLVLDTGIDRDHPDLKDRFEAGKNFVIRRTLEGTAAAYDYFDAIGHGTHVAGTIAASQNGVGVVGVAPAAKILAGRVCGQFGCSTLAVVAGLNWAIEQKVDVVNMSLGGPMSMPAQTRAVDAADAAGIVVVAASGNDGHLGVSYPAAEDNSLAVGAIDSTNTRASFSNWGPQLDLMAPGVAILSPIPVGSGRESSAEILISGTSRKVESVGFVGSPLVNSVGGELHFVGLGKPEDFSGFPAGKIALIERGEIPFVEKVKNAISAGAKAIVIYNNAPGLTSGALTQDGSEVARPVVMIEKSVGDELREALLAQRNPSLTFSIVRSDYASFQGTSMASPHAAGVAALVKSAAKHLSGADVRRILKESASRPGFTDPSNEYGAGYINAEAALRMALR